VTAPRRQPVSLLFLIGDTGGGHRSAAQAVAQALEHAWPGRYAPHIRDPLTGPGCPLRLRWFVGLYAPMIRWCPWLWGILWRAYGSPRTLNWLRGTLLSQAYATVAAAVAACRPAMIVAFHPMTVEPAVRVRDLGAALVRPEPAVPVIPVPAVTAVSVITGVPVVPVITGVPAVPVIPGVPAVPVITVITDLITAHLSWRDAAVDRVIVPSAAIAGRCAKDGMPEGRYVQAGLPVAAEFCLPPLSEDERHALQRSLGLRGRFLVVVTGGAEGSGGIYRRTAAILRHVTDVDVAVICGRNKLLRRRLNRLATRSGGRLTAHGFVANMADWLRCADIVVGKAGPGTIAEATCCAAPLVLTSYVPGQEEGNAEFVTAAGAGVYTPRPRTLAAQIERLRDDPAALAAMRAASARLGRPRAAAEIAGLLAEIADGIRCASDPAPPALISNAQ
jgi:1,2-diacylglycerol 3-beta-galactosyltransferase